MKFAVSVVGFVLLVAGLAFGQVPDAGPPVCAYCGASNVGPGCRTSCPQYTPPSGGGSDGGTSAAGSAGAALGSAIGQALGDAMGTSERALAWKAEMARATAERDAWAQARVLQMQREEAVARGQGLAAWQACKRRHKLEMEEADRRYRERINGIMAKFKPVEGASGSAPRWAQMSTEERRGRFHPLGGAAPPEPGPRKLKTIGMKEPGAPFEPMQGGKPRTLEPYAMKEPLAPFKPMTGPKVVRAPVDKEPGERAGAPASKPKPKPAPPAPLPTRFAARPATADDPGDASVVDLRGKAGIVDPRAARGELPAGPAAVAASGAPAPARPGLPGPPQGSTFNQAAALAPGGQGFDGASGGAQAGAPVVVGAPGVASGLGGGAQAGAPIVANAPGAATGFGGGAPAGAPVVANASGAASGSGGGAQVGAPGTVSSPGAAPAPAGPPPAEVPVAPAAPVAPTAVALGGGRIEAFPSGKVDDPGLTPLAPAPAGPAPQSAVEQAAGMAQLGKDLANQNASPEAQAAAWSQAWDDKTPGAPLGAVAVAPPPVGAPVAQPPLPQPPVAGPPERPPVPVPVQVAAAPVRPPPVPTLPAEPPVRPRPPLPPTQPPRPPVLPPTPDETIRFDGGGLWLPGSR